MSLKSICFSLCLPTPSSPNTALISSFPFKNPHHFPVSNSSSCSSRTLLHFSNKFDSKVLCEDDDVDMVVDEDIEIEIEKTGRNCRRIRSEIGIEAPLATVWNLLTDYERLADFIPGLAVCQLLQKSENYARLFQIGEQDVAFGVKFNAKGVVDCYENPLERIENDLGGVTLKREIEFNMVEGDFEIFRGKWSLQQLNTSGEIASDPFVGQKVQTTTTLSYLVDVKPKMLLPVMLVEGRLCKEIKINLACIREEALKMTRETLLLVLFTNVDIPQVIAYIQSHALTSGDSDETNVRDSRFLHESDETRLICLKLQSLITKDLRVLEYAIPNLKCSS